MLLFAIWYYYYIIYIIELWKHCLNLLKAMRVKYIKDDSTAYFGPKYRIKFHLRR